MASKYECDCGTVVRTNLFSGNGLHVLVPEQVLDTAGDQIDATFVDVLLAKCVVVAECPTCHLVAFVDDEYRVRFYRAV